MGSLAEPAGDGKRGRQLEKAGHRDDPAPGGCNEGQGNGITQLTAVCMATNTAVIRLLNRLGSTRISAADAGVVELRIDLERSVSAADRDP